MIQRPESFKKQVIIMNEDQLLSMRTRASHKPYFTKKSDLQIFCLETIEYSDLGSLLEHYFPMTDKGLPLIRV